MNKPTIRFSGNVAAKPALRPVDTPNGPVVVATLRVAVTPRRRGRGPDEWQDDETIWFNVSAWRSLAQHCVASLNQGDRVLVVGALTQRTWKDAAGVERPSFEVAAESVALDLARNAALAVRRTTPVPRQDEPDDAWVSTGEIDTETGAVSLTRPDEGADGVDSEHPEAEPAAV